MYVSIDMDKLCFLHKHHDHETLSGLAFLEAADRSVVIETTDREHFLLNFSALDTRILYRNTTGRDVTGTDDIVLRQMLAELVDNHIKPTLALQVEVLAQVEAVEDDLHAGVSWKYAIGSRKPVKLIELFGLVCEPLDLVAAQTAATVAPQRRAKRGAPPPPPSPEAAPQAGAALKQRASSVRPTIWAVADTMWEQAGKPTDKTVVLNLRKTMMGELEEKHGVKKTSSSNELGNWMKARLG